MRLAHHPPALCSACYNQQPEKDHVDFEAAWDGPVFEGRGDVVKVTIDDLIVCEDCVRTAAALLPDVEREDEISRLKHQVELLTKALEQKAELSDKLRDALAANAKDKQKVAA